MQFSAAVTYNMFVTLGLITAVPVSGGMYTDELLSMFSKSWVDTGWSRSGVSLYSLEGFRDYELF